MPICSVRTISRVLLRLCAPADYVIRLLDLFLILLFLCVCVCIFVSFLCLYLFSFYLYSVYDFNNKYCAVAEVCTLTKYLIRGTAYTVCFPNKKNIKILNSLKSRGLSHIECILFECGFLIDASFLTFNVFMLFYTMCFSYLL